MTLSREQFSQLKAKGLSTEQIIKFESGNKPSSTPSNPLVDTLKSAPGRFAKELTNTNPNVISNVLSGGSAPLRAGMAALQPIYDESKRQVVEMLPGKTDNWMLKGAEGTAVDILSGGVSIKGQKSASQIPVKDLTLGERLGSLPITKILASEKGQAGKASKQSAKAIEGTEQLLKSSDPKFAKSIRRGEVYNPAEQASKYIQKAKNYTEVTDQLRMAEGFPMEERSGIYKGGVLPNDGSEHSRILKLLNDKRSSPQGARDAKAIADIHTKDIEFINQQSKEALKSPEFYQKMKAYYQNLADQASAYSADPSQSAKAEAYKALSQGYQDKTYALDEAVKALNLENAGLGEAAERTSQLAQVERGGVPKGISQEVVESIRPTKLGFVANLAKMLGKKFISPEVKGLTKGIAKSRGKADDAEKIADIIRTIKEGRNPLEADFFVENTPYQVGQLPAPPQRMLPGPEDFRTRDIKEGRLLQNLVSGKKPIKLGGRSEAIEIPQVLESDKQRLIQEYGVPEYPSPKMTLKEFAKVPRGTLSKSAKEALQRRARRQNG